MARMSRIQQVTSQRLKQLVDRRLSVEKLGVLIVDALSHALPHDGYRLMGIDPQSRFINRVLAASENDEWARRDWFRSAYLASDLLSYIEPPNLMQWGLTSVAVQDRQEKCWGFPKEVLNCTTSTEHYAAFYQNECPLGGTLIGTFSASGSWIATLQLYRRELNLPFQRTDVSLLKQLAPSIGKLISNALHFEKTMLEGNDNGPASSGIVIIDRNDEIHFMTAAGEAWLDVLRHCDLRGSNLLPASISSVIAGMKNRGHRGGSSQLIASTSKGRVLVEATPADSDGSAAVMLIPQSKPRVPPPPLEWPLSRQEREVASLVLFGLTNREIAGRLNITDNTVQTHLAHIFDKLDISRRAQLSARFFQDVYLPNLIDMDAQQS
jgi:DNA-binding CsgD family transcriptional regulator